MEKEQVILVDENDQQTGVSEKMEAHRSGALHRAFSIFIFNDKDELLLQQRAFSKYHSAGLWSNTCCSHPQPGEETKDAAQRRLKEEMGFETPVQEIFDFIYRAELGGGLTEHEFDHVFAGRYNGDIIVNKNEVNDHCYRALEKIQEDLSWDPEKYTIWFRIAFPHVKKWKEQLTRAI